jgi:mannose-1-phosphate guanylyltransferase
MRNRTGGAVGEAILLVGGEGTRLRPLTCRTPKPMLPCAGVPFLTHQLVRARDAGVDHVVLATRYRAEVFEEHYGDGTSLGMHLEYVTERVPLGTGGAIHNVAHLLRGGPDDPVLVLNGDVLSGHDLRAQLDLHAARDADITLHLVEVEDARAFGCVPSDESGRVTAFLEKMAEPVTNQVNAGCYVFRRSLIDAIPHGEVVSVERQTFPQLLADGATVLAHLENGYWLDLGTPDAFVRGSCDLVLGRVRSSAVGPLTGAALVLDGASVAADAKLTGGTAVGAGAFVGAGATVDGCVLLDGAHVAPDCVVKDSVVGAGAAVGAGCVLDSVVVGDGARVGARNELRAGARVWVDAVIPDAAIRFSSDA